MQPVPNLLIEHEHSIAADGISEEVLRTDRLFGKAAHARRAARVELLARDQVLFESPAGTDPNGRCERDAFPERPEVELLSQIAQEAKVAAPIPSVPSGEEENPLEGSVAWYRLLIRCMHNVENTRDHGPQVGLTWLDNSGVILGDEVRFHGQPITPEDLARHAILARVDVERLEPEVAL